ncbi:MAG: class I SAM-dependent methyltransferase [Rubripirellula sp.]|nr:class I SAM-dependent methyltransferase [Rubripirellula sp.]
MLQTLKKWNKGRREQRKQRRLNTREGYPTDLNDDTVETIMQVRDCTMTSIERLNGLCEAVRYLSENKIEGDIVECGVWRGGSMMAIASMLSRFDDQDRELFLFDTFEGMSEPTEHDVSIGGVTAETLLDEEDIGDAKSVWCVSSLAEVKSNMAKMDYPTEKVHFIPGKVEDTIPANGPGKIALLRLDTDWYESTAHELEHFFSRLVDGGVLIVDDYGHWQGARKAVDEYFEKHGIGMLLQRLDYTGRIGIYHAEVKRTPIVNAGHSMGRANREAA